MANYTGLEALTGTTDGMTCLVNNQAYDDNAYTMEGAPWFTYNGAPASSLYVNGNMWVGFGSNAEHLKPYRRDGKMWYLYRQEGTIWGADFLKLRWEGYTQHNNASSSSRLIYELFLLADGRLYLHVVEAPSSSGYLGTSSLVCGSNTYALTLGTQAPIDVTMTPTDETGTAWTVSYEAPDIAPPTKYLVRQGTALYRVQEGALVEVQPVGGIVHVPMTGDNTAWVDVNTSLIKRTDDKAQGHSYPITPGVAYTVMAVEAPDRWRVATCATDPSGLGPNESTPVARVLDNKTTVPAAGYALQFTAQAGEAYVYVHISANNQEHATDLSYEQAVSMAATFRAHGDDQPPDGALLISLPSPDVLAWSDAGLQPDVTAHVAGLVAVPQQILMSCDLSNVRIQGLTSIEVGCSGDVRAELSVDGGQTWGDAVALSTLPGVDLEALWASLQPERVLSMRVLLYEGGTLGHIKVNYNITEEDTL